jgi:hypothetical protein
MDITLGTHNPMLIPTILVKPTNGMKRRITGPSSVPTAGPADAPVRFRISPSRHWCQPATRGKI